MRVCALLALVALPAVAHATEPGLDVGHVVDSGVVHDDIPIVDSTGTAWVRINFRLDTSDAPDAAFFAAYDRVVDDYLGRGISVYGLINDEAVSSTLDHTSDAWIALYVQNALAIVDHFKDRVRVYEIINEPNDWAGGTSERFPAATFAKILRDTYAAVKSAHAADRCWQVDLVSGPLFSFDGTSAADYLTDVYAAGADFDGIGYHMYVAQGADSTTADVGSAMAANLGAVWDVIAANDGADTSKQLWVSEFGWRDDVVGDAEQAARMQAGFEAMQQQGHVALATYFTLRDFPDNDWGVYAADGTRRPSADMLAALAGANAAPHGARLVGISAPALVAGATGDVIVTLENRGSATWRDGWRLGAAGGCPDAVGVNAIAWAPTAGYANSTTDARVVLPRDVAPGETIDIDVPVVAPDAAGQYLFAARMVDEGVAWFGPTASAVIDVADSGSGSGSSSGTRGGGCEVGGGAGWLLALLALRRRRCVLAALVACHASAPATPDLAKLGAPGLRAIDPAQLEANIKYLSSDELEGRAPGSRGGARAEEYIAARFAALGLEPAGDHGSYFQTVPLREATRVDAQSSLVIHARGDSFELAQGKDVVLNGDPHAADVSLDAPLVFAGYGFDARGADVKGAIAVIYGGAPRMQGGKPIDSARHAVLADIKVRTVALRAAGARAVIVVYDPARAERMSFASWAPKVVGSSMAWLERGEVASLPVLPTATIDEAALERVHPGMHAIWQQLDRGEAPRVDLGATASLRIRAELKDLSARNVVGVLRGRDLAAEAVVYTAHHDHLGIGPPVNGDAIYNGALDDASGVAAIIEVARAFAALPHRPRRSIVFLAVTGEEKGLLGSDYFAAHPTIPLSSIAADINIDGLTPLYEQFDMVALGAEHSSLAGDAAAAARATGYVVSADPDPDQVYFIRSDQYSFVKRGVPAVFPNAGWRDAHGDTAANKKINDAWAAERYHRPSDEWQPEYRAVWAAKETGFDFLLGLSVAMADERPHWNAGDAFANTLSR